MRRLAHATTIAAVVLTAACDPVAPETATEADWGVTRKADISCLGDVEVVNEDRYDLNEDGRPELFLVMRCLDDNDPDGDQLEVIAGGGDEATARPTKLVLQRPSTVIDGLCFAGRAAIYRVTVDGRSKVWQVTWAPDAAEPGPPAPGPAHGCP